MIYGLEDGKFVISAQQVWRPGTYESERAAHYATMFCDDHLSIMNVAARPGVIRYETMLAFRRDRGFKCEACKRYLNSLKPGASK